MATPLIIVLTSWGRGSPPAILISMHFYILYAGLKSNANSDCWGGPLVYTFFYKKCKGGGLRNPRPKDFSPMLIKIAGGDPRPQDVSTMIEGVRWPPPAIEPLRGYKVKK
jgi:hypothetical protein